jgi:hypothetical protein
LFINVGAEKIVIDADKIKFSQSGAPVNMPLEISGIINAGQLIFLFERDCGRCSGRTKRASRFHRDARRISV